MKEWPNMEIKKPISIIDSIAKVLCIQITAQWQYNYYMWCGENDMNSSSKTHDNTTITFDVQEIPQPKTRFGYFKFEVLLSVFDNCE